MPDWKDFLNKLAEGIKNEPLLTFAVLIIVVLALLGTQILPEFRPLIYIVVIGIVVAYIARLLGFGKKEPVASSSPAIETPTTPPAPPPVVAVMTPPRDARDQYLDSVIADCRPARLVGLDPQAADPSRGGLSLERLYVSLDTLTPVKAEEEGRKKGRASEQEALLDRERTRPLSALEALAQAPDRRMALLGLPGAGKSTFVRYLALRMAQALRDPARDLNDLLPGWKGQPLLPVIIPLGRLAESLPPQSQKGDAGMVERYLEATLSADERAAGFARHLLSALREYGGVVLFDGLDEVADLNLRPVVVQAVEDFAARYARHTAIRFLVTCRKFSYTDPRWQLTDWVTHELAPLDEEKISQFVQAWHAAHTELDPARKADYDSKREKLLEALRPGDRRRLSEIAPNPLILTLMAVVHTHKGDLPDTRAQVYEECIDLLLVRWELERSVLGKPQKRGLLDALGVTRITLERALWEIAYRAHESRAERGGESDDRRAALVTEDLLRGILRVHLDDDAKVQTFLDYCESANGLLMLQGIAPLPDAPPDSPPRQVYAFPHLTFEEYLAARFLMRRSNTGREVRAHLDRSSDRWREVVMLLGEHVCFKEGDFERMDAVVNALSPAASPATLDAKDWRAMWLSGDLLLLYRRASSTRPAADERVRQGLRRLVETGALTSPERAAAGNTLADLGDPRFREDLWFLPDEPLLGFVEIPAGPFLMGSDPNRDQYAQEDEQPQHEVHLPTYHMARYPVTVAQFGVFVKDSGHKPEDERSLRGVPNHPVVRVTWYDALKYGEWLTGKLRDVARQRIAAHNESTNEPAGEAALSLWCGLQDGRLRVTLPSEAEWEKAARGVDRRIYPWAGKFDPSNTNTIESGIGTTSAVGCFPNGVSPYGILDLSGNVWEWTRSLWGKDWEKPAFKYPYDPKDTEREDLKASPDIRRVVRGGAFDLSLRLARCAYRHWDAPDDWYYDVGCRLVVSPF